MYSETSITFTPASLIALAVPPVERISTPYDSRNFARSTSPVLSETERIARLILKSDCVEPNREQSGQWRALNSSNRVSHCAVKKKRICEWLDL